MLNLPYFLVLNFIPIIKAEQSTKGTQALCRRELSVNVVFRALL